MRAGITVLGLEHGADRRGQGSRITQDVAPRVGAKPGIIVRQGDAVHDTTGRRASSIVGAVVDGHAWVSIVDTRFDAESDECVTWVPAA